jgi:tripartite-type tricarboxylate transporter receptor subunit TctC
LAVTTMTRSEVLPDIPTVGEFLSGYESSVIFGAGVPKNTSPAIIDKLNKEINAGLADPRMKARLADLGGTTLPGSSADFGKLIAAISPVPRIAVSASLHALFFPRPPPSITPSALAF